MLDRGVIDDFLAQHRLAVVGVSRDSKGFANVVYRELRERGYEVAAVNPSATTAEGDPCYPDPSAIPGRPVDGAIVMVPRPAAADAVRQCIEAGVPRVWLFRGVGAGTATDEAVALCHEAGVAVVEGACPFMFLDPVRNVHRFHRGVHRLTGRYPKARPAAPTAA